MANKLEHSQHCHKDAIRTQGSLDGFVVWTPSATPSSHSTLSSPTPNNTSPSGEALSTTQSQYTLAGLHHAPHDNTSTDTATKAPLHEAREEQEGGSDNETDDEVEELIEGSDLVGRAEAAGVWSQAEIQKRLDDILAKEGVKWAMPYHQVRLESCPMTTVLINIKLHQYQFLQEFSNLHSKGRKTIEASTLMAEIHQVTKCWKLGLRARLTDVMVDD